jgi:hypothetical protein
LPENLSEMAVQGVAIWKIYQPVYDKDNRNDSDCGIRDYGDWSVVSRHMAYSAWFARDSVGMVSWRNLSNQAMKARTNGGTEREHTAENTCPPTTPSFLFTAFRGRTGSRDSPSAWHSRLARLEGGFISCVASGVVGVL